MAEEKPLQQEFDLLQKKQKERLRLRQMQKGDAASSQIKSELKAADETKMWGMDGQAGFDLDLPTNKEDQGVSFHDVNSNEELLEAIRELRDENGRLYKLLGEKDAELKMLQRRWSEEKKELIGNSVGSDNAVTKIISLSKKSRELTAELEHERSKVKQMKKELQENATIMQQSHNNMKNSDKQIDDNVDATKANEVQLLQEKLKLTTSKLLEQKQQAEIVKKELKLAQKVLSNEVGEGVTIQSLMNAPATWRGRQQQIISLQNKLNEMQLQLAASKQQGMITPSWNGSVSSTSSASSIGVQRPLMNHAPSVSVSLSVHEERHRSSLKRTEFDRREAHEKLKVELESAEEDLGQLKVKLKAARSRNDVLAQDVKYWREEAKRSQEKSKRDDELIAASMREQEALKEENLKLSKKIASVPKTVRVQNGDYRNNINSNNDRSRGDDSDKSSLVQHLQQKVREQETEVIALQQELTSLQRHPSSNHGSHGNRPSSRSLLNGEAHVDLQETRSLLQVAQVEREKLLELTRQHQKRLDGEVGKSLDLKDQCANLRRKNANLEKRVEKMEGNSNSTARGASRSNIQSRSTGKAKRESGGDTSSRHEDLETRLLIQTDENDALKEALNSTMESKQEDLKIYESMIDHSKRIFMQGLRQLRDGQETPTHSKADYIERS